MKVYTIISGQFHDHTDIISVKGTLEEAREIALEHVSEINRKLRFNLEEQGHMELFRPCLETSDYYWTNTESYVKIQEFEI